MTGCAEHSVHVLCLGTTRSTSASCRYSLKAAAVYGIGAAEVGRASLDRAAGSPAGVRWLRGSILLVGLAEVEFGDHQRYTLLWALSAALVMMLATGSCFLA
ncbi:hypothetical protein ACU4GD_17815 [Cupriavidus basilensis]